jgi:hypothetical protein
VTPAASRKSESKGRPSRRPAASAGTKPQRNASVWLKELSRTLGERATRNDTPHAKLDRLAAIGFDRVKFRSAWQAGPARVGIVLGARAQIILSSRADSVETWLASCALAALVARA